MTIDLGFIAILLTIGMFREKDKGRHDNISMAFVITIIGMVVVQLFG